MSKIEDVATALFAAADAAGPIEDRHPEASADREYWLGLAKDALDAAGEERFFLSQDNDSHWYVIPVSKQKEWDEWREIDTDDEEAWEAPDWALRTYGAPSMVTFTNPNIEIK